MDAGGLERFRSHIEALIVEVVRREVGAALLPATRLTETLEAAVPVIVRLESRLDRIERRVNASEAAVVDKVLAALVQVTQHLEALQAATAWATLGELDRRQ